MTQGDLRLNEPGQRADILLVADSGGTVADRGDVLELAGETGDSTTARLVETAGNGVGTLVDRPSDFDPDATYAAGEEIGQTTALTTGPVDWFAPSDGYTATVGNLVVFDAGGTIRAYDSAGGDTADMIAGRVFATGARETAQTTDKVAVLRRI